MRYEHIIQLVQRRGIFFGTTIIPYTSPNPKSLISTFGTKRKVANDLLILAERPRAKLMAFKRRLRVGLGGLGRQRNLAYQYIKWSYPHLGVIPAYAWRLIYYFRVSHWRSYRYLLGLPSRGQRTRCNAKSPRRGAGAHLALIQKLMRTKLFAWSRAKAPLLRKKSKQAPKGTGKKTKQLKKGIKAVKKKKLDVWR